MEGFKPTSTATLLAVATIACSIFLLDRALGIKPSANEPPYIPPKIPLIGHAIGLLRNKYDYYIGLSIKHSLPIYGLAIPGMPRGKVYVINSPDLVLAVQRQPKKLSFWFLEATFTVGMAGLSKEAAIALQDNVHGDDDRPSLFMDGMRATHKELKPCEGLDQMSLTAVRKLAASINRLIEHDIKQVDLWHWVEHELIASTTDSVYGPQNPFRDPEIVNAFLDFEEGAVGLLSYPFPSVTCSKAYAGREKVVTAFEKYHNENGSQIASHFVKARGKTSNGYNLSINDQARFDAVNGHAILANTTPTAFWTLFHILSNPKLLEEVRQQVMPLLTVEYENGNPLRTICISNIRDVPILNSILHESLRHYASGTGSRIALEDTMLDDRYLLQKDCFIFMPNHSYHFDGAAWGPTVKDFDANRFLKGNKSAHHAGAFRGFGGGVNLCPGRFFAMNEILSMCAMLALRYDIKPASKEGWIHPGEDNSNMSLIVNPPKRKIMVKVVTRKGWEGGSWAFKL